MKHFVLNICMQSTTSRNQNKIIRAFPQAFTVVGTSCNRGGNTLMKKGYHKILRGIVTGEKKISWQFQDGLKTIFAFTYQKYSSLHLILPCSIPPNFYIFQRKVLKISDLNQRLFTCALTSCNQPWGTTALPQFIYACALSRRSQMCQFENDAAKHKKSF